MTYILVFLGCFFAASSAIFVKLSTVSSMVLLFYRLLLTCILLLPIFIKQHKDGVKIPDSKTLYATILSGICFGLHLFTFFEALKHTGITETNILVNTELLFVAFVEMLIFRKKIKLLSWIFLILAMFGVYIVLSDKGFDFGKSSFYGNALALIAAITSALYTIFGKYARKHLNTSYYTFLVYFVALVETLILSILSKQNILVMDQYNIYLALGLAVFPTLLGHNIFSLSLKKLDASYVSAAKLSIPIFASFLGLIIFGQSPSLQVIIGSGIMIVSIVIYTLISKRENELKV